MSERPEITAALSAALEKKINPYNDPRIYWAKKVTFDKQIKEYLLDITELRKEIQKEKAREEKKWERKDVLLQDAGIFLIMPW